MKKVSFDDSLYRIFVKDFFKKEFDVELIDTPDSYFKIELSNKIDDYRLFISGKYNFDLIPFNDYELLTFVEVETVREDNSVFDKSRYTFNILASKYWKYCICSSRPGKIVYVEINKKLHPTGRLAVIDSTDILRNCDLNNYKVLPSKINHKGQCALYEIPKGNFIEYYNYNRIQNDSNESFISNLIKVSNEAREKYWERFQNYSINNSYLKNCNILRFQGYEQIRPFKEVNCEYFVNLKDVKDKIDSKKFNGYSILSVDVVMKFGKKIEK